MQPHAQGDHAPESAPFRIARQVAALAVGAVAIGGGLFLGFWAVTYSSVNSAFLLLIALAWAAGAVGLGWVGYRMTLFVIDVLAWLLWGRTGHGLQFRLHTMLGLMTVACVVLATWRESAAALGFVLVVFAAALAVLVLRRRGYAPGLRLCYGALVGLITGMLFVTTREAHNYREEIALLGAAALGGALGGWLVGSRDEAPSQGHPLDPAADEELDARRNRIET